MYDFILLDCPPSLGLLTINALTAAEELIVPIQCEYYALEGLGQLLRNVSLVQHNINPGLRLSGIVMTMFDPRTKLSEQVVEEVRRYFGHVVYDIIIPRTVRLSEAPGFGQPITVYDPKSKGAACYRELAREVALRPPPSEPMPVYDDLPTVVVPPIEAPPPQRSDEEELGDVPTVADLVAPDPQPEPPAEPQPEPKAEPKPEPKAEPQPDGREPAREAERPPERPTDRAPASSATPSSERVIEDDDIWEGSEAGSEQRRRVRPPTEPPPPGHLPERRVVIIDENEDRSPAPPDPGRGDPEAGAPEAHSVAEIGATLREGGGTHKRRWRLFRKGGE